MSDEYKYVTASIQWHLTPSGWSKGSSTDEDGERYEKSIPEDRVLTLSHSIAGSAIRGKKEDTKVIWMENNSTLIEQLKTKYGAKPKSFW